MQYNYGMIGLGTMGCNLVLNMSDHNFSVAGYDKDVKKIENLDKLNGGKNVKGFTDVETFINALQLPRVVMLLVPAGPIVDAVVNDIKPFLAKEDIIVDCGNSHFTDTQRRIDALEKEGFHFFGLGVSGGEKGARFGPSIMPGGNVDAYKRLAPMLEAISAKVNGVSCTAYMGGGAAGHYVKMVHNGIEYAAMQMIAETYHLLKKYGGLNNEEMHIVFDSWNKGRLQSFLIEITASIFTKKDDASEGMLVDKIKDTAKQKGTGAWMSQDAMATGSPIPAIDASVTARILSSMKKDRVAAANIFSDIELSIVTDDKTGFIKLIEEALYAAFIITYAQGLAMLKNSSDVYKYNTDLKTVAKIWRGGCIIRAAMLEDIMQAYEQEPALKNLLNSNLFTEKIKVAQASLRKVVQLGAQIGIPLPSFAASLNYFDAYKSAWLPANLIQAQRDFFGAHTYERLDMEGVFHTKW